MTLDGRTIVCVGFAEWDAELWTNQQHLMSRLARHNDVTFERGGVRFRAHVPDEVEFKFEFEFTSKLKLKY